MTTPIPFVDLRAAHAELRADLMPDLEEVMEAAAFVGGEQVERFEQEYAEFAGAGHCIGVANGTDAIELALRASGVGPGSEVIIPANTFIATAEAVARAGATPVLVDVDQATLLIDPDRIGAVMTPRTRAVIPVHLYGRLADVADVRTAVEGRDIVVVEDAAQSQGAHRTGATPRVQGDIAATSFYPGKNLGAYGDAGAVTTDDPGLARTVRVLGSHGGLQKYVHEAVGFNSRLDALQAVVLRHKLRRLHGWNALRRRAAERYSRLLVDIPKIATPPPAGEDHVWHLYVVRVPEREVALDHLARHQIGAGIHYPTPLHLTGAFRHLADGPGSFPIAEAAADEILSLPIFPQITATQQERVAAALQEVLEA